MKVNQTIVQNKLCTNILYIFLTISAQRDTILSGLINKLYPTKYKGVNKGYLNVAQNRRYEIGNWTRDNIISNDAIMCPLFVTHKHFWGNEIKVEKVLDYIKRVNTTFSADLASLTPERCEEVTKTNLEKFCRCPGKDFISTECNAKRQCTHGG